MKTVAIGAAMAGVIGAISIGAQGRCMLTFGAPGCSTAAVTPVFDPTGWKTVALDHITVQVADHRKEAAFYVALMGWTLRSVDDNQAVLDIGNWGSAIFKSGSPRAVVSSFCFVIDQWSAKKVDADLRTRGLTPVADNDGKGFESFHVKDPDGFDLQISNGNGLAKNRRATAGAATAAPAPFDSTGWKTVWLDHFSLSVTNYKESASFYANLLGWTSTYDEGSQNELLMADVGNVIIRGGNPLDPRYTAPAIRSARIDHISFGIEPWDTDGVKADLEKRGLRARVDTSSRHLAPDGTWVPDDIHTAAFKSYHTTTPNGYDLQISYVTRDKRLALSNAVRPKPPVK